MHLKNLLNNNEKELEMDLFSNMELRDLIDDGDDQILITEELYEAFKSSSKDKKYYLESEKRMCDLFKHICCIYNDAMDELDKYGALTYLERVVDLMDVIEVSDITDVSFEQLNQLLDANDDKEVLSIYNTILKNRQMLTNAQFPLFKELLKNTKAKVNLSEATKVYNHICTIYNENTILQDNVDRNEFLRAFSQLSFKKILSMRMIEIIEMFKIQVNFENINEARLLVNDLNSNGVCLN